MNVTLDIGKLNEHIHPPSCSLRLFITRKGDHAELSDLDAHSHVCVMPHNLPELITLGFLICKHDNNVYIVRTILWI